MEAFTAEHSIKIDEILYEWPASRFQAFYEAFSKRKVAEELAQRRAVQVAALLGNPNLQSEQDSNLLPNAMKDMDENFSKAIGALYGEVEEDLEPDWDDPFYAAMKRGMEERKLPSEVDE